MMLVAPFLLVADFIQTGRGSHIRQVMNMNEESQGTDWLTPAGAQSSDRRLLRASLSPGEIMRSGCTC